ncbi:MAG: nitroreductase family protein [Alistipes sp.]|nr:nitroreductase [Rikenellaceae bacterium]MBP3474572.1 nitroreductase family protein [Alistipes sp.]MBR7115438.1 nitroreductase family protein [Alistipes sp.]
MELKEIISRRRSTRKFLPTPVERERLERVVEMALQAPSSRNSRSTRFMIVQNPDLLEKMSRMRDYGSAFMKDAAAAILVMGDKRATDLWIDNCAISATTLQLAVVDEGLASCWVHVNDRPCLQAEPDGRKADDYLRELLDLPEHYGILCAVALGYSDFEPKPLPPYEGEERVIWK